MCVLLISNDFDKVKFMQNTSKTLEYNIMYDIDLVQVKHGEENLTALVICILLYLEDNVLKVFQDYFKITS